jgi:Mg-chelatase subunit ChlD
MQTADVIFVIDASGSVGTSNFVEMKNFVSTLVISMQVGSNSVRVGVMTFSTTPS